MPLCRRGLCGRLAGDVQGEPVLGRDAHVLAGLRPAGGKLRLPAFAVHQYLAVRIQRHHDRRVFADE
jgi:hypothetical protein